VSGSGEGCSRDGHRENEQAAGAPPRHARHQTVPPTVGICSRPYPQTMETQVVNQETEIPARRADGAAANISKA
jgi:hypothetical protein